MAEYKHVKKANKKKASTNPINYYNTRVEPDDFVNDVSELAKIGNDGYLTDTKKCIYIPIKEVEGYYRIEGIPKHNDLTEGKAYSKFELLQAYRFNGNFKASLSYVLANHMDTDWPYIMVVDDFYKIIYKQNDWGIKERKLQGYKKEAIKLLEGKEGLDRTAQRHFEGFIMMPDNKDYKPVVDGYFNMYQPFPHTELAAKVTNDDISYTLDFMRHVFGEQFELGLDYMKILYENPKQMLPILVLVSSERHTGKTSFLDYISILFGPNYAQLVAADLMGDFNAHYAGANIIGVDESLVDKVHAVERVKSLVTSRRLMVNDKYIKAYTIPFYGKLIMTSNKVTDFMKVDQKEIRFWVRRLKPFGKIDPKFFERLKEEIPYFLTYLENRKAPEHKSRMVFSPEDIRNNELIDVMDESKSSLCKDIEIRMEEFMLEDADLKEVHATVTDINNAWYQNNNTITLNYIRKVLKEEMELEPTEPTYYEKHLLGRTGSLSSTPYQTSTGRYYTFKRSRFCVGQNRGAEPIIMDDDEEVPF